MRTREMLAEQERDVKAARRHDKETRATLVLDVIEKSLEASASAHEKLKVTQDLMINVAKDVLEDKIPETGRAATVATVAQAV